MGFSLFISTGTGMGSGLLEPRMLRRLDWNEGIVVNMMEEDLNMHLRRRVDIYARRYESYHES
jgi:hypothetical protein